MSPRQSKSRIFIGVSGWVYPPWRGVFYPRGLPHARELGFIADHFPTVEVNGSFYSLLRPATYQRWHAATPPGFVFAVKGSRFITHMKRLANVRVPLANFFASGILALGEKLGPILWQLPASVAFDPARFAAFFEMLPRSRGEASALAREHDHRLDGRCLLTTADDGPLRHALEPRHPSFASPDCLRLLRAHDVALCAADTAGRFPSFDESTASFAYVRLHGDTELYVSGYEEPALDAWAARIDAWHRGGRRGRDVFVYFDNDARVRAPYDAQALAGRLGVQPSLVVPPLAGAGEPARTVWPAWAPRPPARRAS